MERREPVFLQARRRSASRCPSSISAIGAAPLRWVLAYPVALGNEGAGAIVLAGIHTPADDAAEGVRDAARQLAVALHNAWTHDRLREKSIALAEQGERLTRANKVKTAFLASMSHELRTPLSAILGLRGSPAHVVEGAALAAGARVARAHQAQRRAPARASSTTCSIWRRPRRGASRCASAPVNVGLLARACVAEVESLRSGKNLRLGVDAGEAPIETVTDAQRVRQILLNLLANAIKFTDEGEVVLTRAGHGQRGAARRARHGHRHPRARDEGALPGLPPARGGRRAALRGHRRRAGALAAARARARRGDRRAIARRARARRSRSSCRAWRRRSSRASRRTRCSRRRSRRPAATRRSRERAARRSRRSATRRATSSSSTTSPTRSRSTRRSSARTATRSARRRAGSRRCARSTSASRSSSCSTCRCRASTASRSCERLRARRGGGPAVIMLTAARREPHAIEAGLKEGADAYLTKPIDSRELVARVRAALETFRLKRVLEAQRRDHVAMLVHDLRHPLSSLGLIAEVLESEDLTAGRAAGDGRRRSAACAPRWRAWSTASSPRAASRRASSRSSRAPSRRARSSSPMLAVFTPVATRRRVALAFEGSLDLEVHADPHKLRQALDNVARQRAQVHAARRPRPRARRARGGARRRRRCSRSPTPGPGIARGRARPHLRPLQAGLARASRGRRRAGAGHRPGHRRGAPRDDRA